MTDENTKVIFLDIDGPMIPGTQLLVDRMSSWTRTFPPHTIAVIRELCERTGAVVVFNTTHNRKFNAVDDIEIAAVRQGLPASAIHPTDFKTEYPFVERGEAIANWLGRHQEVTHWVAIDDAAFVDDARLILVDPLAGVDIHHLNAAINLLGCDNPVLMAI